MLRANKLRILRRAAGEHDHHAALVADQVAFYGGELKGALLHHVRDGIALWYVEKNANIAKLQVQVDQGDFFIQRRKRTCQIHRNGGLADPAFR